MSVRRREIDREKMRNSLKNYRRSTSSKTMTIKEREHEKLDEEESMTYRVSNFFKKQYHIILKSNFPAYFCLMMYSIICLFGNLVTAILLLRHYAISPQKNDIDNSSWKEIFQIELIEDNSTRGPEIDFDDYDNELDLYLPFLKQFSNGVSYCTTI